MVFPPDGMTSLRAFIAIEIPTLVQQAIFASTSDLRRVLNTKCVRWVPVENLHLTLKFLGDISSANVNLISDMLATEAARVAPFSIEMSGLGSFPNPRRARVIWIGIHAQAALESLAHGIEAACVRLGYEAEERPFSPHLTIGRVKQPLSTAEQQTVRTALEQARVGNIGATHVKAVHLFKSELRTSGSIYTRLFSASLNSKLMFGSQTITNEVKL
jgi:2'-5' RNA ligase